MSRTTVEKIESIQTLIQEQKERERKARTKRLIERGAILESLIPDADTFTNEQIKAFLEKTIRTESARKARENLTTVHSEQAVAKAAGEVQGSGTGALKAGTSATGEKG